MFQIMYIKNVIRDVYHAQVKERINAQSVNLNMNFIMIFLMITNVTLNVLIIIITMTIIISNVQ